MIADALLVATGAALLSVAVFLIVYAVRARGAWWSDPLGRAIMLGGFAVGSLAAIGTARRIDTRIESIHLAYEITVASIFAYLAVAGVWLSKVRVVYKETRRRRYDERDKENHHG